MLYQSQGLHGKICSSCVCGSNGVLTRNRKRVKAKGIKRQNCNQCLFLRKEKDISPGFGFAILLWQLFHSIFFFSVFTLQWLHFNYFV